jgi:hypothetical protein
MEAVASLPPPKHHTQAGSDLRVMSHSIITTYSILVTFKGKAKFVLALIMEHAMKTGGNGGKAPFILKLSTR